MSFTHIIYENIGSWSVPATYFVSLCLIVAIYNSRKRKIVNEHLLPKVPGALPIVGNPLGENGLDDFYSKIEEWADTYGKEKGLYKCNVFGKRIVVLCSIENATKIAKLRPYKVKRGKKLRAAIESVGGYGAFAGEGEEWRASRRLVSPILNEKHVRGYLPVIKLVSKRLVQKWAKQSKNGDVVIINDDAVRFTMDIVNLFAFGRDIDTLGSPNSTEAQDLLTIFKMIFKRTFAPFAYWKIPFVGQYLDGGGWARRRLLNSLNATIQNYEESDLNENDPRSSTFLAKLIQKCKEDKSNIPRHLKVGHIMTVLAAASESTSSTLATCLWQIAIDSNGLQRELAVEAEGITDIDDASFSEIMDRLPRIRSLFYEVVRVKGAAPLIVLENVEEVEIGKIVFPPLTSFLLPLRYLGKLPSKAVPLGPKGEQPCEFCARRWLVHEGNKSSGSSVVDVQKPSASMGDTMVFGTGFGTGVRICPGDKLAEAEIIVCLATLLRSFEISLKKDHPEIRLVTRFTDKPDQDICLVLKPRTMKEL